MLDIKIREIFSREGGRKKRQKLVFPAISFLVFFTLNSFSKLEAKSIQPEERAVLIFLQAFDKENFVDNIAASDLEISLDGSPLKIDGLVLVKGSKVKRTEGKAIASPILPRVLILEFRGYQYEQKLGQVVEQLFRHPYSPTDMISLVTPVKPYGFSEQTLRDYSVEQLINAGLTVLKRDISSTGQKQLDIIQEMTRLILDLPQATSPRDVLREYQQNLENLKMLRLFDEATIRRAVDFYAPTRAQKRYIVICQQEFLPTPSAEMMERLLSHQDTMFQASELFRKIESAEGIELEPLISELTSSGIVLDLLYFKTNPRVRPEIQLRELSTDMFDIYSKIARATGGMVEATNTPAAQLKKILTNSENYYLISCTLEGQATDVSRISLGKPALRLKNPSLSLVYFKL